MKKENKIYCLTLFQPESEGSCYFSSNEKTERIEAVIGIIQNEATNTYGKAFVTNKGFLRILKDEVDLEILDKEQDLESIVFLERKTIGRNYSFMYEFLCQNFSNVFTETLNIGDVSIDSIQDKILESESINYHY
ncbi:MAG: hypothetical protein JKY54_02825 [Flavobacteriales bacterium]|nr:hypothetical protein [Flavobacteriales bacterium]